MVKNLFVVVALLFAFGLEAAELPEKLRGTWHYSLFSVPGGPFVQRVRGCSRKNLYEAYRDHFVAADGEILKIKDVVVVTNDWIRTVYDISFVDSNLSLTVLYMKEARAWSVNRLHRGEYIDTYYFYVRKR